MTGRSIALRTAFYRVKPFLPRRLQIALRRVRARWKRSGVADWWPIDRRAGAPPAGFAGWPEEKRFAFVLTHDVESARGCGRCSKLAEIEEAFGFRSSFNFVAEDYETPAALRRELGGRGFEVGLHGLRHDGSLFASLDNFLGQAERINEYLASWNAVGFRSPSMYRNLAWIHALAATYDASTFDADPFEPQPDGAGTIFPFRVERPDGTPGYVELPCTLPQDLTLFVILGERTIRWWRRKLAWIARRGGMALVITHPDYMHFGGPRRACDEYPVHLYEELLLHVETEYGGSYWHALPRDVARFWMARGKR